MTITVDHEADRNESVLAQVLHDGHGAPEVVTDCDYEIEKLESAAMPNTDPQERYTGSMREQLRLLPVGRSCAKVEPLRFAVPPIENDVNALKTMREGLRNSLASSVAQASAVTGGKYTIEVGETCMPSGNIFVTAVVTRIS